MDNRRTDKSLRLLLITVVAVLLLALKSADGRRHRRVESRKVTAVGVVGRQVKLSCDIPRSSPPRVKWMDYVHNVGREAQLIFNSDDNPHREVAADHPKVENFVVDSNFSLSISSLSGESPGQYICQSVVNGETHELVYELTVLDMPKCSGVTQLAAGSRTALGCELSYSGNEQPTLEWFRLRHVHHRQETETGDEPGTPVASEDQFELQETGPIARRVVRLHAHHSDDGATYTCRMTAANMAEECKVTLNVTYLVRDLKFHPHKVEVETGDELRCEARGNPTPEISVEPKFASEKGGPGWKAFVLTEDLADEELTLRCTATNTVEGTTETLTRNHTVKVSARQQHHNHEQTPHNDHPQNPSNTDVKPAAGTSQDGNPSGNGYAGHYGGCVLLTGLSAMFVMLAVM